MSDLNTQAGESSETKDQATSEEQSAEKGNSTQAEQYPRVAAKPFQSAAGQIVEETLATRDSTHGDARTQFRVAQRIKEAFRNSPNWDDLPDYAKESLEMKATKISRILCGNPLHMDHWVDDSGYSQCAIECLELDLEGR